MNRKGMFISLLVAALGSSAAMAAQDRPILVGQSASLTGGQAKYGQDVRDGIEAMFAAVNAKGGVRGRPLQLVSLDDGGTKATVLANTGWSYLSCKSVRSGSKSRYATRTYELGLSAHELYS